MKTMKLLAYTLIASMLIISCKSKEKLNTSNSNKIESSSNHSDSIFFKMKKTACLGQCPTYNLEIKHSGQAYIQAKQHLSFEGELSSSFSQIELDSIKTMIYACDYFNLEKSYDGPITDIPSTITEVHLNNQTNRVRNRYKGPKSLSVLERYVHGLVMSKSWK